MREEEQREIVVHAVRRLDEDLLELAPFSAPRVRAWASRLAGGAKTEEYFLHLRAFPFVGLPVWFELSVRGEVDPALHRALACSSIAGYYFIRILDGLMDGDATDEVSFLPVLGVLHERFQSPYATLFGADHAFWPRFRRTWSGCLDATTEDAAHGAPTLEDFFRVTARKVEAASLPLLAVALHLGREAELAPWMAVFERFGRWHLMEEDLLDVSVDAARGARTFALSEAERRRAPHESAIGWLLAGGIDELAGTLGAWMRELRASALALESPPLVRYLDARARGLDERLAAMRPGLRALTRLASALEGAK